MNYESEVDIMNEKNALEKYRQQYAQAEKKFKKIQRRKICLLFFISILIVIASLLSRLLDVDSIYLKPALMSGVISVLFLCFNLLFSKMEFENTGGGMYFDEEDED